MHGLPWHAEHDLRALPEGQTARLPELRGVKGARVGRAGVLGMGTMGTGIAQALLMAGLHVTACDQNEAALQGGAVRSLSPSNDRWQKVTDRPPKPGSAGPADHDARFAGRWPVRP